MPSVCFCKSTQFWAGKVTLQNWGIQKFVKLNFADRIKVYFVSPGMCDFVRNWNLAQLEFFGKILLLRQCKAELFCVTQYVFLWEEIMSKRSAPRDSDQGPPTKWIKVSNEERAPVVGQQPFPPAISPIVRFDFGWVWKPEFVRWILQLSETNPPNPERSDQ